MIEKILLLGLICAKSATAQAANPPATAAPLASAVTISAPTAAAAPPRSYTFDIVSIRHDKDSSTRQAAAKDGPTADGYINHQPLLLLLMTAYVPQVGGAAFYSWQNQVKGLPDWLMTEHYDIDARIADQDRTEWQNPQSQKIMLRTMLQALLADRCKLAVHRELKESQVTTLVVAKGGPRLKQADPATEHPDGQPLPFGGVLVSSSSGISFYGTSMGSLASLLSSLTNEGRPVQDKTGLAGQYDFTFKLGSQSIAGAATDPESPLAAMILSGLNNLGLKLQSEKGQVETLVIDHIEQPSEN